MENPWMSIDLKDYEKHMELDSVMQLQAMNEMMHGQFYAYAIRSVMVLGIAGGNGLNHITPSAFDRVYGVDINPSYLEECIKRYPRLQDIFQPVQADLLHTSLTLPQAEMLIANLLIEYIGYTAFQQAVRASQPEYVSCIIQLNTDSQFVSDSPYLHVFDRLDEVHAQISEEELNDSMQAIGYSFHYKEAKPLPNGKQLLRLDYRRS